MILSQCIKNGLLHVLNGKSYKKMYNEFKKKTHKNMLLSKYMASGKIIAKMTNMTTFCIPVKDGIVYNDI